MHLNKKRDALMKSGKRGEVDRKGSIEISFGMIISIILIIAVIGVAVYAITSFLDIGHATELSLFHQRFSETIEDIWASAITDKVVSFSLPRGVELVCFGDLDGNSFNPQYEGAFDELKRYSSNFERQNTNRFIYPTQKAGEFAYKKVDKIDLSELHAGFDCFEVRNGKIQIRFVKDNFDSLVRIRKP